MKRQFWTPREDAIVRRMVARGIGSCKEIAEELQRKGFRRTASAVKSRRQFLQIEVVNYRGHIELDDPDRPPYINPKEWRERKERDEKARELRLRNGDRYVYAMAMQWRNDNWMPGDPLP